MPPEAKNPFCRIEAHGRPAGAARILGCGALASRDIRATTGALKGVIGVDDMASTA
jgi:hypothetical protein